MGYSIDTIESSFEWELEALQKGFADPNEYIEWKDDQTYLANEEEEKRAYLEQEALENKIERDENQFEEEEDAETIFTLEENNGINMKLFA